MSSNDSNELQAAAAAPLAPSRRRFLRQAAITVAGVAAGASSLTAHADPAPKTDQAGAKTPTPPSPPTKAPIPGYVDAKFSDFIAGYDKLPGLFTLYRYKNDILMEVTPSDIGQLYMLDATMATGDAWMGTVGQPLGDMAFRIEKQNDSIVFVEPNDLFRATAKTPEEVSISRSFADSFLTSFPIIAINLSKDDQTKADAMTDKVAKGIFMDGAAVSYLIALKTFFVSDITDFVQSLQGYHIDPANSYIQNVGVYPANVTVQSLYAMTGGPSPLMQMFGGEPTVVDDRSVPISIFYNILSIPDGAGSDAQAYVPRYYDDRIGYFTADYETFDDDVSQDNIRRLIQRWHLVKKDPKAAVSDPEKPITFWIDNGMPIRYRPAAQEAVLSWNKAFELIGFSNAVVCNIMPDDADWDIADTRYNVIRWMTSPGAGYAVALFRHNPFTGEIFSASVNIDASMARFTNTDYPIILSAMTGETDSAADTGISSSRTQAQAMQMNLLPVSDGVTTRLLSPKQVAEAIVHPKKPSVSSTRCKCELPTMSQAHAAFGWDAIDLQGLDGNDINISLEEYTHAYLRMVLCHEVGHCLGLRHNFKGSTMLSPDQLGDADMLDKYEISSSVMDYLPPNVAPLGCKPVPKYFSAGPGPYDLWAISYGYSDFGNVIPAADLAPLRAIASQDRAFGHDFGSDENADDVDPSITRFDLSGDPCAFRLLMIARGATMISNAALKYPDDGDDYYELTRRFRRIFFNMIFDGFELSRFIGGVLTSHNHRGDPGAVAPIRPVPFAQQRTALKGICDTLLSETAFAEPASMLSDLQEDPRPYSDNILFSGEGMTDFSWLDLFTAVQEVGMVIVLNPFQLSRLETNEFRAIAMPGSDAPLTVLEVFQAVTNTIWSELLTPPEPAMAKLGALSISVLRRRSQRIYLTLVSELLTIDFTGLGSDSQSVAYYELRRIAHMIDRAQLRPMDPTTQVHLAQIHDGIQRLLQTKDVIPVGFGMASY